MCKFKTLGVSWPPQGWEQFEMIDQSYGQAILKNPISAVVTGMSYVIEPVPVIDKTNQRKYAYAVRIDGWDYNIYNESSEYSILSFTIYEKLQRDRSNKLFVSKIKTRSQSLPKTYESGKRIMNAAIFMMKKIERGDVPDFDKILRMYKVHPTQRRLYASRDYMPKHSLLCGLKDVLAHQEKCDAP